MTCQRCKELEAELEAQKQAATDAIDWYEQIKASLAAADKRIDEAREIIENYTAYYDEEDDVPVCHCCQDDGYWGPMTHKRNCRIKKWLEGE